jgi:hypothetical protein
MTGFPSRESDMTTFDAFNNPSFPVLSQTRIEDFMNLEHYNKVFQPSNLDLK